jgi:hypothetical protein
MPTGFKADQSHGNVIRAAQPFRGKEMAKRFTAIGGE